MERPQAAALVLRDPRVLGSERVFDVLYIAGVFFDFSFYFILRGAGLHAG